MVIKKLKLVRCGYGLLIALLSLLVASCGDHSQEKTKNILITVSSKPLATTLYYSGTLQPLGGTILTSPVEGVIQDMNFHYGDVVKKGQVLFAITSEKFFLDYKSAVMQYIKAKSEKATSESQLVQNEFLHKNQLISDDTLKERKTSFYNAQLSLLQATDSLATLLKLLDMKGINPYEIKIEEINKITQALKVQGDAQKLKIVAPVTGVAVLPRSDENDTKHTGKGESVKQNDVLALIGDLSGLKIRININEFNVNQLKMGQKVHVTGTAFPEFVLEGEITGIDHQATSGQGGVPMFPVEVTVLKLTPAQQAIIHVGMSAKVEINIESENKIIVPLTAVYERDGVAYVKKKVSSSSDLKEIKVKTGETTLDSVVIQEGLSPGDQILKAL